MKLEKVKSNHGMLYIRGPYKDRTAYIATFINMPEYEKMVDWIIANYPINQSLDSDSKKPQDS